MGLLGVRPGYAGEIEIDANQIRYYRAQMVGGDVFPICAVARRGGDEMAGTPGKWPNSVELQSSSADAFIVEEFL